MQQVALILIREVVCAWIIRKLPEPVNLLFVRKTTRAKEQPENDAKNDNDENHNANHGFFRKFRKFGGGGRCGWHSFIVALEVYEKMSSCALLRALVARQEVDIRLYGSYFCHHLIGIHLPGSGPGAAGVIPRSGGVLCRVAARARAKVREEI